MFVLDVYVRDVAVVAGGLASPPTANYSISIQGGITDMPALLIPFSMHPRELIRLRLGHSVTVDIKSGKSLLIPSAGASSAAQPRHLLLSLLASTGESMISLCTGVLDTSDLYDECCDGPCLRRCGVTCNDLGGNAVMTSNLLLKLQKVDSNIVPFLQQGYTPKSIASSSKPTISAHSTSIREVKTLFPDSIPPPQTAAIANDAYAPPLLGLTTSLPRKEKVVLPQSTGRLAGERASGIASRLKIALSEAAANRTLSAATNTATAGVDSPETPHTDLPTASGATPPTVSGEPIVPSGELPTSARSHNVTAQMPILCKSLRVKLAAEREQHRIAKMRSAAQPPSIMRSSFVDAANDVPSADEMARITMIKNPSTAMDSHDAVKQFAADNAVPEYAQYARFFPYTEPEHIDVGEELPVEQPDTLTSIPSVSSLGISAIAERKDETFNNSLFISGLLGTQHSFAECKEDAIRENE